MVLQSLVIKKQNVALHGREELQKERKRTLFPKGLGRAITEDGMEEAIRQAAHEKEDEDQAKKARGVQAKLQAEAKKAAKVPWQELLLAHELAVTSWTLRCDKLKKQGIKKAQWPKRPKHPLKRDLEQAVKVMGNGEAEDQIAPGDWTEDDNKDS